MNAVTEKLLLLSHCRGLSPANLRKLYLIDPSKSLLLSLKPSDYLSLGLVSQNSSSAFTADFRSLEPAYIQKNLEKEGVSFLTMNDSYYPRGLKEIPDPPVLLFYKGDVSLLLQKHSLGVAGSRACTAYGLDSLTKVLVPLIKKKFVIISGLAEGIDAAAHRLAINNGGKTIAVLGGGFQHIYPRSNIKLAQDISKNHLLLSEYPPAMKPQKWHFPERNRLISGLSSGLLIPEAKHRSGSLITAQFALEQGKEVFAIPGKISDSTSDGTNELIKDGAKLVMNYRDILEEFAGVNNETIHPN
ncbi:DNA-processing protein DprA [Metabacillus sp. 84]|uniref:DNA-processing protein DprA n=1 Tax=unclassified Metabacillus TaxID=2675274 RepID=UPI003CE7B391